MVNEADDAVMRAERDAGLEKFSSSPALEAEEPVGVEEKHIRREMLARTPAASTSGDSDVSSNESVERQEIGISRRPTVHDGEFEQISTAMSRIQTGRSQHDTTVGTSLRSRTKTRDSKKPLPEFGGGKPYPATLPDREEYVVEFDGPNDPLHAQNWPLKKKLAVGVTLAYVTFVAAFGSSVFSTAIGSVAQQFGTSQEVGILGVSLYVLGFATGPLVWAPFSELYGRKTPLLIGSFGFSIFQLAVATGKDLQTIFLSRFFGGFFGACPLTCVGAVFADMFNNRQRGLAITVFAMTVFSGPLMGPSVGGFIIMNPHMGWRWTEYITGIMGFLGFGLSLIFLEETYPPVILVNKAAELRRRTKNWGIHAKQEEIEVDLRELLQKNLSRPIRILFTEPIVLAISIYMAFVYGLLYLFLTFYPIVFQKVHGFNPGEGGLPFFGMILGEICAGIFIVILQPRYNRKLAANNDIPIPEWRLPPVIVGGVVFACGMFWFAWGGYKASTHWIVPTLSGLFTGFGLLTIFLQCLNYLIDVYMMFAASAIAANTILRSLCGASFPLFATYMIEGMGVQWAGTMLGCIAFALVPLPVLFYLKGAKIREKSSFAPTFSLALQASRTEGEDPEKRR